MDRMTDIKGLVERLRDEAELTAFQTEIVMGILERLSRREFHRETIFLGDEIPLSTTVQGNKNG